MKELLASLHTHLRESGIDGIPSAWFREASGQAARPSKLEIEVSLRAPAPTSQAGEEADVRQAASDATSLVNSLDILREDAQSCRKCRLSETRTNVVFGVGNQQKPKIVFVGEGPGADEDRLGEPFVGKAGALLTAAITKGLQMKREDVYICNVVKCRPPQNRAPLPDEVSACSPYLYGQLEALQPSVIVTLGSPAQKALTGVDQGITKLRGHWLDWRGIPLMPTFHPAYILRNPAAKRPFWEDLQAVMQRLGIG